MEIMLSHLGIGMAYDALDGLDIHAQRLHLRHIGVAATVRREQADIARFFQRFAEHIPEMGGIAGQAGLMFSSTTLPSDAAPFRIWTPSPFGVISV